MCAGVFAAAAFKALKQSEQLQRVAEGLLSSSFDVAESVPLSFRSDED